MNASNISYKLRVDGNGKIPAGLAKMSAQGEVGEFLVRDGITQASFCLFLARIAFLFITEKKRSAEQVADAFCALSGANASAAQKAFLSYVYISLEALDANGESILDKAGNPTWEKEQSFETFWGKGGAKAPINLSVLD